MWVPHVASYQGMSESIVEHGPLDKACGISPRLCGCARPKLGHLDERFICETSGQSFSLQPGLILNLEFVFD